MDSPRFLVARLVRFPYFAVWVWETGLVKTGSTVGIST